MMIPNVFIYNLTNYILYTILDIVYHLNEPSSYQKQSFFISFQ